MEMTSAEYAASEELERVGLEGQSEIAYALVRIANELSSVAYALRALGNADAATPMGALEAFGLVMKEGMERIADGLDGRQ